MTDDGAPLTGLTLAEARAYAAAPARGCRPRTSGSSPPRRACSSAPSRSSGTGRRASTRDGRTRFAILKGGSDYAPRAPTGTSTAAPQPPEFSLQLLLAGPLQRSPQIGFRLAVDLVTRPLEGIRVVEAATLFAAPLAGMLLGDYGADVIKIEHPRAPDPARGHGPAKDGDGPLVQGARRATSGSITLDLSQPDGRDLFLRLAERADVVLENFRPGTLERWGLGPDELSARQPAARARARQRLRADRAVRAAARASARSPRR